MRRAPTPGQRVLLVLFGLGLLLPIELGLRLAGFGGAPPLLLPLVEEPDGEDAALHVVNPRVAELFFARREAGGVAVFGAHRREVLLRPKPPGRLRVAFLGASTVEGFPLPRNLAAAQFLARMLQHAAPERQVEVLNLGVTAVASFPVRLLGEAALEELEPDLLLVYTGHNELFGAAGVASRQFLGRRVTGMEAVYALRRLALLQGVEAMLRPGAQEGRLPEQNLIEVMAALPAVEPGGPLHEAAGRTLVGNLERLAAAARRHRVPVVLATVASNERDLAPLASWSAGDGEPSTPPTAESGGDAAAWERLRAAHPRHAGVAHGLARALAAQGDREGATRHFRLARDLDAQPWRASRQSNDRIRDLARRLDLPLADCEASFAAAAGGAPGWELFYDHVHPSLRGQALLAETFYEVIRDRRLLPQQPAPAAPAPGWRHLARSLGAHPLEHYLIAHKMAILFRASPIGRHNEAAGERFARLTRRLERRFDPVERFAVQRWRRASSNAGYALPISFFAGSAALALGHPQRAVVYLEAAQGNADDLSDERSAAQLLTLLALRAAGAGAEARARLPDYLEQASTTARTAGQPTALLAASLAGLESLHGRAQLAREWAGRAEALLPAIDGKGRELLAELSLVAAPGAPSVARVTLVGEVQSNAAVRAEAGALRPQRSLAGGAMAEGEQHSGSPQQEPAADPHQQPGP
ncbi:MAG TPA: hypothetical protein VMT16_06995 [Thermoanaerobaculia bacterium]|nr:hypothetical protein [Thermoanaerobaculia bacterium]